MLRQKIFALCVILAISVILILAKYQYLSTKNCNLGMTIPVQRHNNDSNDYVETILEMTRLKIKLELWDYNFSASGVSKLEDLLIENGGTPTRNIIVSTWRSGSSFLGDLINAMPSHFYHYEPLVNHNDKQMKIQKQILYARLISENFLNCNYTNVEEYFRYGKYYMNYTYFSFNKRLWESCKLKKQLCADQVFTARFCKLFPFQIMKVVRLRLRHFEQIMDDGDLNVRVVLLVRDPRGVMQSRKRVDFCVDPDCSDPERLCSDMISDYVAAKHLLQKYPDRLMVLRYEDLVLNINATTDRLLQFLRLQRSQEIDEFISTHTKTNKGNNYSTFRVSKDVPFLWKSRLGFNYVAKIQEVCNHAMSLWGYELASNASQMTNASFNPLKPFSI